MPQIPLAIKLPFIMSQFFVLLYQLCCIILHCYTVRLFAVGEGEIRSTESTTQGDPFTIIALYALVVVPLIRTLHAAILEASYIVRGFDAIKVSSLSCFLSGVFR